jgi:hypothetical protein
MHRSKAHTRAAWYCPLALVIALAACGGGGSRPSAGTPGSGGACQSDPQGDVCQGCLSNARSTCVNRGTCAGEYNTAETCTVNMTTTGAPASCDSQYNTLTDCLNSQCGEWNDCLMH